MGKTDEDLKPEANEATKPDVTPDPPPEPETPEQAG